MKLDREFEQLLAKLQNEQFKRVERDKNRYFFKVYISQQANPKQPQYGILPSLPQKYLMGAPMITTEWWFDLDHYPHASSFGAGDCMQCSHVPHALEVLADAIEGWLQ